MESRTEGRLSLEPQHPLKRRLILGHNTEWAQETMSGWRSRQTLNRARTAQAAFAAGVAAYAAVGAVLMAVSSLLLLRLTRAAPLRGPMAVPGAERPMRGATS